MNTARPLFLLLVPLAACSGPEREEPAPYLRPAEPAGQGGPVERVDPIVRTGVEFQPWRGTKTGDTFLDGKLEAIRVTDDSALGILHGTIQLKSRSAQPVGGQWRCVFCDDEGKPVGEVFSTWKPYRIDDPFGTLTLSAAASARAAVYFVYEFK